ncbi:MAG: SDR family NAD(P)-dependent oxidoreductase [Planctomycetota bacterium]|nr:SDR family NAD(P)-dependent oxidoreductase [Planctomycetota bacterium]
MSSAESPQTGIHIIFGAAGGIGTALCHRLARAGHTVIAASRTPERLAGLESLPNIHTVVADPGNPSSVDALLVKVVQEQGRIDGVANLAGAFLLKPAHLTSDEEFAQQIQTNLVTAFNVLRSAVRHFGEGGGSIVLMSSVAATMGLANHEAVAASKAGIEGLTRSAAATYASRRIRINAVAPGLTRTPLTARLTANEASLKASAAMHPLGRIGEPEEVASAIAWLLSSDAAWVTGQTIGVDGGLSKVRSRG